MLLALPSAAGAQISGPCSKFAAPGGADSAAGTQAHPLRSARGLVKSLAAGQTGCLRRGTYRESLTVTRGGAPGRPVTLRNYPGERVRLVGRLVVKKRADHMAVEGLFLNGRNPARLPSPTVNADHVAFRMNDVTNGHTAVCFLIGASDIDNSVSWGRAQATVIENNRIHNCGKLPAANHDHGIYVEGADDAQIRNNWIYDNADRGIQLYPDAQRTLVTGNVIDSNGSGLIFSGEGDTASNHNVVSGNLITNSVLRGNVESWWADGVGEGNILSGNCVGGGPRDGGDGAINTSGGGYVSRDNLLGSPGYADRRLGDYRLSAKSPCRALYAAGDAIPGPEGRLGAPRRSALRRRRRALRLAVRGSGLDTGPGHSWTRALDIR